MRMKKKNTIRPQRNEVALYFYSIPENFFFESHAFFLSEFFLLDSDSDHRARKNISIQMILCFFF